MSQNLKDKMLNYQVAPPAGLWDSIAFELDKEIIASKLNNYEVAPPAFIWDKIEEELDKVENKVIKFVPKAKVFTLGKIAAAASVAFILGISVWFFTQTKKPAVDESIATNTPKNTTNGNNTSVTPNVATNSNLVLTSDSQERKKESNSIANVTTKKEKFTEVGGNEMVTTNPTQELAKNPFENKEEKLFDKQGGTPENIDLVSTPNSYLTIVGPNGQSVKISSKFSKQLGLFTKRDPDKMENIDFIIEESAKWRNKIAAWRSKMNTADVSPSLDNFMDIIELSKKVDTDKKK